MPKIRSARLLALLTLGLGLQLSITVDAAPVTTDQVRAELITEVVSVMPGDRFWVALKLEIADGWHTYWRNPGDSGQATQIDWRSPAAVETGEIQWPYPERLPYGPLINYGYTGTALHLVQLRLAPDWLAGEPLELSAEARWLVCAELCIPQRGTLTLVIPTQSRATRLDTATAPLFERARAALPVENSWPARFGVIEDRLVLELDAGIEPDTITDAHFFPSEWGVVDHAAPQQVDYTEGTLRLTTTVGEAPPGDRLDGVLVIHRSAERPGTTRGPTRAFAISARSGLRPGLASPTR